MRDKKKGGITLIALVITIILLLVLAGISMSVITNDGGLFEKAKEAKVSMNRATAKKAIQMAIVGSYLEGNGVLNAENLKVKLQELGAEVTVEGEENPSNGNGGSNPATPNTTQTPHPYITTGYTGVKLNEVKGVNTPKLVPGLIPVTYNENGVSQELTEDQYSTWYDYTNTSNPQWANAITKNNNGYIIGLSSDVGYVYNYYCGFRVVLVA